MKPHINIGTIGHIDHRKTSLTAAICTALNATLQPPPDEPLHVYDWLDQPAADENERLAKEWLEQFVRPADEKDRQWLDRYLLICDYQSETYHCTGASRMGDVWLRVVGSTNFYDLRVNVEDLSNWKRVERPPSTTPKQKPRSSSMIGLLAMTAMLAGSLGIGGGRSSAMERNDPNREKTPEDLERMETAQRKRDRKAARKGLPNDKIELPQ